MLFGAGWKSRGLRCCVNMLKRTVKRPERHDAPSRRVPWSCSMPNSASEAFVKHLHVELPAHAPGSFEDYTALVGPMFDLVRMDVRAPFEARVDVTMLPDLYLSQTQAGGIRHIRDDKVIARSGTDAIVVLVYRRGDFTLDIDGRQECIQSGDIVFLDLQQPMCIQAERVDNVSLVVSRQRLEALTPRVPDLHGFVLRAGALHDLLLSHLLALADAAPSLPAADAEVLTDLSVRLLAASLNGMSRRLAVSGRYADQALLGELKRFIDDHLEDGGLSPAQLMQTFGLSRARLYRLFESAGGVSAYMLERRLQRAASSLTGQSGPAPLLQELAHRLGFSQASAFSRAFKRRFGVSPQTVRRTASVPADAAAKPWQVPRAARRLIENAERTPPDPG